MRREENWLRKSDTTQHTVRFQATGRVGGSEFGLSTGLSQRSALPKPSNVVGKVFGRTTLSNSICAPVSDCLIGCGPRSK